MKLLCFSIAGLGFCSLFYGILLFVGLSQDHKMRKHPMLINPSSQWLHLTDQSLSDPVDKTKYYVIEILENSEASLDKLENWVKTNKLQDQILIQSRFTQVLDYVREKKPRWLTSQSPAEMNFYIFLSRIGLQSLAPLPGDVVLLDKTTLDPEYKPYLREEEFLRRHKKILVSTDWSHHLNTYWKTLP